MLVLVDNRDSFVWNLAQAFEVAGAEVRVLRAAETDVAAVAALDPTHLVLGPGPGGPAAARACHDALDAFAGRVPILGVCLGMQVVAEHHGARVVRGEPVHGHPARAHHTDDGLWRGVPDPCVVGRYHSLRVEAGSVPDALVVDATTEDGTILSLRHRELAVFGVQFHPESILSEHGGALLENFLARRATGAAGATGATVATVATDTTGATDARAADAANAGVRASGAAAAAAAADGDALAASRSAVPR